MQIKTYTIADTIVTATFTYYEGGALDSATYSVDGIAIAYELDSNNPFPSGESELHDGINALHSYLHDPAFPKPDFIA